MSFAELFVVVLVALFVLRPEHIPPIARGCGKFYRQLQVFYVQLSGLVDQQIKKEALTENTKKANAADAIYQSKASKKTD